MEYLTTFDRPTPRMLRVLLLFAVLVLVSPVPPAGAQARALCVPQAQSEALTHDVAYAAWPSGDEVCVGPFTDADVAAASRVVHPALASARVAPAPPALRRADAWASEPVSPDGGVTMLGVRRGRTRDVVLVHKVDSFEGEPGPDWLLVLDGPTGRAYRLQAWDAVLAPDERYLIFGRPYAAVDETGELSEAVLARRAARDSGLPVAEVRRGVFENGFTDGSAHVVRPHVLDLETGSITAFGVAAGGALRCVEERVYATRRPRYWAFGPGHAGSPEPVLELWVDPVRAAVLTGAEAAEARRELAQSSFRYVDAEDRTPRAVGGRFARTRGGRLMMQLVSAGGPGDGHRWLQAVRTAGARPQEEGGTVD